MKARKSCGGWKKEKLIVPYYYSECCCKSYKLDRINRVFWFAAYPRVEMIRHYPRRYPIWLALYPHSYASALEASIAMTCSSVEPPCLGRILYMRTVSVRQIGRPGAARRDVQERAF